MMYIQRGQIPAKRHTIFKSKKGAYYYEQLFGTEGFSGKSSLLYHINRPTQIIREGEKENKIIRSVVKNNITPRKLYGFNVNTKQDFLQSKTTLFFNRDVKIGLASPLDSMTTYFYKNVDADELLFIHEGSGTLCTLFGNIEFVKGDYLVIPKGCIFQIKFDTSKNKVLFFESKQKIEFPKRYLNQFGQLMEHAPFCERDLKVPKFVEPQNKEGEFAVKILKQDILHTLYYKKHPFDIVGWDGFHYPYGLSIYDFEPITGRIHQPPPIHQTFSTKSAVVCSFVPRLFDYHPKAIPAPYNHSNIDSEEVIYYVEGDFMSRSGIKPGQFTLHPGGIPHGPHPLTMEKSIGKKDTKELAVMIDTFQPLELTEDAIKIEDESYVTSWLD